MINGHPQETTRYPRDRDRSCWGSDSDGRRVAAISALLQLFHALAVASRYLTNIGKVGLWAWIGLRDYVLELVRFGPAALTRWFCRRAGMATIKLETSPRGLRLPWVSGACGWFSVNEHRADGAPAFRCLMGGDGTSHRRGIHVDAVSGFRGPLSNSGSLSAAERSAVLAGPTWIAGMLPRRSNPQRPPPAHPGSEKERKGATNARDGRHCSFSLLIAPGNGEIRSPSLLFAPFRSHRC